jgi:hypothetical protein
LTAFAQSSEAQASTNISPEADAYQSAEPSVSQTLPLMETVCLPLTSSPELTALQRSTGKNFALLGGGYQIRQKVAERDCTPLAAIGEPSGEPRAKSSNVLAPLSATASAAALSENAALTAMQNAGGAQTASAQLAWWMGGVVKPSSEVPPSSSSIAVSNSQALARQPQAVSSFATQSLTSLTSQSLSREDTWQQPIWQQPLPTAANTNVRQEQSSSFSAATQASAVAASATTAAHPTTYNAQQHQGLPEYPAPLAVNGAWMIETLQHPAGKTSAEAHDTLAAATPTAMLSVRVYSKQFPKPDAQVVRIHYTVPEQAIVRLQVLNVAGKEVTKLVELMHGAGEYEAEWHGKRADGSPAESGLYHYRLTMLYANKRVNTQTGSLAFVR